MNMWVLGLFMFMAKDEKAASFYKKYDFIESPINEFSLFF